MRDNDFIDYNCFYILVGHPKKISSKSMDFYQQPLFLLGELSSFLSCITCSYAKHSDLYMWQVPFCNISCLALLTLQLVWFVAISRRAVIFMKQLICVFKDQSNVRHRTRSFSKNNYSQPFNSAVSSNCMER